MSSIRSYDGYGNNQANPEWGRSETQLLRLTTPSYHGDGETPVLNRPNARMISNVVCDQREDTAAGNAAGLTDFMWAWGQFLDHELDLSDAAEPRDDSISIEVEVGDPILPDGGKIPQVRSRFDPSTGGYANRPRQQINLHSSFVDASNVYGANAERSVALRTLTGGKLKASDLSDHKKALLPKNVGGLFNDRGPAKPPRSADDFFVAGDARANEHVVLTCMHTLFLREHNRLCDEFKAEEPNLEDEELYQRARRYVIAEMQVITYTDFLPALLGKDAIGHYCGYDPTVNPSIGNVFSTAAYRLGHSMLSPSILLVPPGGSPTTKPLALRDAFWRPEYFEENTNAVDQILNGLSQQPMQEIDTRAVDDIRNFLFHEQITGSDRMLDLAALNIQRGREHGLADYNQCRVDFGLPRKHTFSDISSVIETSERLAHAYSGDLSLIDPWVGGLAEDHVGDSQVGEFFYHVLRDQFKRLRDGDRFWYENDPALTADEKTSLAEITLAQVIEQNTNVKFAPGRNVFRMPLDSAPRVASK